MRRFRLLQALGLALLLGAPARAEPIKLATWNLNWLTLRQAGDPALPADVHPRAAEDFQLLADYAAKLQADVVALEEVDGPEAAARLFPPARYALFFTRDAVVQRVGFAVRRGLAVEQHDDLRGLDVAAPGAFHLRSGADITLHLPGGTLRLLAVHLKSGCSDGTLRGPRGRACTELAAQIPALAAWVAARAGEGLAFGVLGDFNRHAHPDDPLFAALAGAAPLLRATAGFADPCWRPGDFIDHILLFGPARSWMLPHSLRVMLYRETDPAMKERLSDHCPVSIRMDVHP